MNIIIKNAFTCSKCHSLFVRGISLSSQFCDINKEDENKFKDMFKDVKPTDMGIREKYKDQIKFQNPFVRTGRMVKNDMKFLGYKIKQFMGFDAELSHDVNAQFFPTHTDVLIIGGGIIGSSIAYWLKQRAPHGMHVLIAEMPTLYDNNSLYSMGGITQQYSLPENILMAQYGAEFYKNIHKHLSIDNKADAEVNFTPHGYLFLANQKNAQRLKDNAELQAKMGVRNILMSANKLKQQFPWINTDGVEIACLGLQNEGWMNPLTILNAFKSKSINLGAEFIEAEVVDFDIQVDVNTVAATPDGKYERVERAIVKLPSGDIRAIKFGFCVIAAGANSGDLARLTKMGEGSALMSVPLPIEPRKRSVYSYSCPNGPSIDMPLVVDPSGVFFRRHDLGGSYVAGVVPDFNKDGSYNNVNDLFQETLLPILSNRVPAFEKSRLEKTLSYIDDYNTMDENGIFGQHPLCHNILFATGFSNNGIQNAPAIGRAMMELLLDGEYKTINLSRFGFDRLCLGEPINENQCSL